MHRYRILICCVLTFTQMHSECQAQTAYLQSNRVFEGDIAELIIEYESKIPSLYALDTSALELEFEVLDIKPRVARVMESNEVFHRMQWKIELLPRRTGSLSIPGITVGDASTPELTLEVVSQPPGMRLMQNVFVEVQAQPENPYVGQLTQVTIRLLHNTPLSDGSLYEAETENADVYRMAKDSRYVTTRNGEEFNVLERKIALVARAPGEIRLSPASYRGQLSTTPDPSGTAPVAGSRRINRYSEALRLQVRTPPPEFSGDTWLPAMQLQMTQRWDEIAGTLNVGDSLGFTLTIEATGLPAAALPAGLVSVDSTGLKIYADQELRTNRYQDKTLVGRLEQRFAVVVSQPGEIEIPAILLKWWDVTEDIERVVVLEAKKLTVINPAATLSGSGESTTSHPNHLSAETPGLASLRDHWQWLALISLVLLIGGFTVFITPVCDAVKRKIGSLVTTRRNRKALQRACMSNDPVAARHELLKWGRGRWPDDSILGLHQIATRTGSSALVRELSRLDAAVYANHHSAWQGQALWRLVAAERSQHPARSALPENSLPGLYPRQDSSLQATTR